jgi:hypothetical protein
MRPLVRLSRKELRRFQLFSICFLPFQRLPSPISHFCFLLSAFPARLLLFAVALSPLPSAICYCPFAIGHSAFSISAFQLFSVCSLPFQLFSVSPPIAPREQSRPTPLPRSLDTLHCFRLGNLVLSRALVKRLLRPGWGTLPSSVSPL